MGSSLVSYPSSPPTSYRDSSTDSRHRRSRTSPKKSYVLWSFQRILEPHLHDATCCQTGRQSDLTTGCQSAFTAGWMFVYMIQPAVIPVSHPVGQQVVLCIQTSTTGYQTGCTTGCSIVQPVGQPAASCKRTGNLLSNLFDNRLDVFLHDAAGCTTDLFNNQLYRVHGVLDSPPSTSSVL